jgi:hypothetical protein
MQVSVLAEMYRLSTRMLTELTAIHINKSLSKLMINRDLAVINSSLRINCAGDINM